MPRDGRELLAWLVEEGASGLERVVIRPAAGGLGLFAAEEVEGNAEIFCCPCSTVLTSGHALQDAVIGPALRSAGKLIDRHHCTMLYLLHRRRFEHAAYVASLPKSELVRELPLHWTPDEQEWLRGSSLFQQVRDAATTLRDFHERVVLGVLCANYPKAFPLEHYGFSDLCWAHACYWSRAINVPMPGGLQEGMCPLLDMCNHDPGVTSSIQLVSLPIGRGSSLAQTPAYMLRSGRRIAKGEEIFLNCMVTSARDAACSDLIPYHEAQFTCLAPSH